MQAALVSYIDKDAPQYCVLLKYSGEFIDDIAPHASKNEIALAQEALAVTREPFDVVEGFMAIRSLKTRSRFAVREIPLPSHRLQELAGLGANHHAHLRTWPWSRG